MGVGEGKRDGEREWLGDDFHRTFVVLQLQKYERTSPQLIKVLEHGLELDAPGLNLIADLVYNEYHHVLTVDGGSERITGRRGGDACATKLRRGVNLTAKGCGRWGEGTEVTG